MHTQIYICIYIYIYIYLCVCACVSIFIYAAHARFVSMEPFRVQGFGALGIERSLGFKGPGGVSALIS